MGFILYLLALAIFTVAACIGFFILNKKNQIITGKKAIIYYLSFSILIMLGGLVGYVPGASRSMAIFFALQVVYLAIGYGASVVFNKNVLGNFNSGGISGVFFILSNALFGMIGFSVIYHFFNPSGLAPYFATCVLPFLLPQFLKTSFDQYRLIPQDIYNIWYFPLHADEIDFDHIDTTTIFMLELEYSKSINDPRLINTKLRAPIAMNFGDWFRSFIENYNYKFESDPIHFLDESNSPQGWMFYVKPSLLGTPKYINADMSIAENKISEKNIIIAKRVGMVQES